MEDLKIKYILKSAKNIQGINILEECGKKEVYPANYVLVHAGGFINCCYIVKKGRVAVCEYSQNGERRIYYYSEENTLIMEEYLLGKEKCPFEYITTQPTELIRIGQGQLLDILKEDIDISGGVIKILAEKLLYMEERIRFEKKHSAAWKICGILLNFAELYGNEKEGRVIIKEKISQQEMADMVGVNRITLLRVMKTLHEKNLVSKVGKYYCISNIEELLQYQKQIV